LNRHNISSLHHWNDRPRRLYPIDDFDLPVMETQAKGDLGDFTRWHRIHELELSDERRRLARPRQGNARPSGHDGRHLSRGLVQPPFPALTNPGNRYKIRLSMIRSGTAPVPSENTAMCPFVYILQGLWMLFVLYQYVNLFEPASNRTETGRNRLQTGPKRAFFARIGGRAGAAGGVRDG